jgi:hypothetical protein
LKVKSGNAQGCAKMSVKAAMQGYIQHLACLAGPSLRDNNMNCLKKPFAFRISFDYIAAPRQSSLSSTVKCLSGLRSTPGKRVYEKSYREFESLLHRHIRKAPRS